MSKRFVVFVLAIIFLAPGLMAYLYYSHPNWLRGSSTNRGQLITPVYYLKSLDNRQRWRLIYWNPLPCSTACMQRVDALARVRLALGRRLYQVDACLILPHQESFLNQQQTKILQDEDICVLKLPNSAQSDSTTLGKQPAFFIVSPNNALVLTYPVTANSDDLFHDIKQLIAAP